MQKLIFLALTVFFTLSLTAQHVWERANPGGGGAIAMVGATADGTILAASDLSGVYKTTDNGISWEVLGSTQGLLETNINCFGFHPTDGDVFLIGTGIGVYKTTDGGNTIYPVNIETDPNIGLGYVESMAMDMVNGDIGYMAHHEYWEPEVTILKTTDGGENWSILTATGMPVDARITKLIVDHSDPNLVYGLTGKARYGCSEPNLYKSSNGGLDWTEIASFADIMDVDLHPTNSSIIYVSTFEANDCSQPLWQYVGGDENTGELYKSTDGGVSFIEIGDKSGVISVGTNPDHISVTDIFNPALENSNAGTWKTTDGGSNWQHTGFVQDWFTGWANSNSFIYSLSFNGVIKTLTKDRFNPDRLCGAFGQWAWSSIDGGDVLNNISTISYGEGLFSSTGLENIEGHCIDVSDSNPNTVYMGGYDLGFWYSRNHGESWKRSLPNTADYDAYSWFAAGGSNCNIVVNDPERENVVWASFSAEQPETRSALFKSDEFGEDWVISNTGLDAMGVEMHGLSLDINSPVNNRTLYLTQNGNVFKSTNDGANWTSVLQNGGLKFTAVDQVDSQLIYAGGESGLWRSTNGGDSWIEVGLPEMAYSASVPGAVMREDIVPTSSVPWANPPIDAWAGVFDIKTDPNHGGRLYVAAYGPGKGLYRSDDEGDTWIKLISNSKMRGVAIAPGNSDIIYASSSHSYHSGGYDANSIGFSASYDGGVTWLEANEDLAWTHGGSMEIESGNEPHLWAWSPGTGIQHTPICSLIDIYFPNSPECNLTTLPVELLDFTVTPKKNITAVLKWVTAFEERNAGFHIERSSAGMNWIDIGYIPSRGNSSEQQDYRFEDENIEPGLYYYRLRQIDVDGEYTYSPIRNITLSSVVNPFSISIFPNPVDAGGLTVTISNMEERDGSAQMIDMLGRVIRQQSFSNSSFMFNTYNLSPGAYWLVISVDGNSKRKKVVVN